MATSRKADQRDKDRGAYLSLLRARAGLTQAQVADSLGVSMQQYGKYERGENRMPTNRYDAVIGLLRTPDDLQHGFSDEQQPFGPDAPGDSHGVMKAELQRLLDRIRSDLEDCVRIAARL